MQSLSTHDQRMLSYDYRWSQFKTGASRRNISVDIDKRQYTQLICSPCHYCARTPAAAFRIGIDRIDSSKAYTSSNCVSCCKSCNFMKNTMRYGRLYFTSAARCASAFLRFDEALHRATATFIAKASARAFTATKPTHTAGARASPLPCAPL